jgi:uncharacterized protein (DUF3084 family)
MSSSELQAALLALDEITAQRDDARRELDVMTHEHRLACVDRDAMQRERDEARREVCQKHEHGYFTDEDYAEVRGWDCFKEDGK